MQDVCPPHNGRLLHPLCLGRLQLLRILLPLNIAVIMPSHPLQDRVHVRFLVPFRSASVALIQQPMNPQNFRNTMCTVSYLVMNLPLSKFLKRMTNRHTSLQFYDR